MRRGPDRGRRPGGDRGFTLIEILAALVVLGLLIAGLAQAVHFGLVSWRVGTRAIAQDADLDQTARLLDRLLAQTRVGSLSGPASVIGTEGELALTTRLAVEIGTPPTQFADLSIGVVGAGGAGDHAGDHAGGRLVLRLVPHYHAVRIGPAPKPDQITLADGVSGVRFAYYSRENRRWDRTWNGAEPPALFRISVSFENGHRHWPPIVVAPLIAGVAQ